MNLATSAAKGGDIVIDAHCHIASLDFIPPSFVDGMVANMELALSSQGIRANASKVKALYLSKFQDPLCDELVAEMDAAGIHQAVLLAADFTFALKDSRRTVEDLLLHHQMVCQRHAGRFHVFAGVDPRWGGDGVDLFERSIRSFGFHGLKLYPPCGFHPGDPMLYPYYEICSSWKIPVLVHIGGTCPLLAFDTASPVALDKVARDFSDVNFILAHGSVAYVEECAMMCAFRPNVYLDVSGFQTADLAMIEALFRRGFRHKILFGTDWPLFRLQGSQCDFLSRLTAESGPLEQLRNHELRAFLGGTLANLLGKRATASSQPESQSRTSVQAD